MRTKGLSGSGAFHGWVPLSMILDQFWQECNGRKSLTISAKPLVRDTARYWLHLGRWNTDIAGSGGSFSACLRGEFLNELVGILGILQHTDCSNGSLRIAYEESAGTFHFNFRQLTFYFDVGPIGKHDGWSVSKRYTVVGQSY